MFVRALAAWNTSFGTFNFVAVLEGTASSPAGLAAFNKYLSLWAFWEAGSFSPVFNSDAFLGAGHGVEASSVTHDLVGWTATVVGHTLLVVWHVVDKVVALFESSGLKDCTSLLGNWCSLFVLYTWVKAVLSWCLGAFRISLPFLDKRKGSFFYITFWCKEVISSFAVKVTAKTGKESHSFSGDSEGNSIMLVPHDSSAHASDRDVVVANSLDKKLANLNWKVFDLFSFDVNSTANKKLDFLALSVEDE